MQEKDNIRIQTLHFDAGQQLMEFVWNKTEQLNKVYDRIERCDVILKKDHDGKNEDKVVEMNIVIPQKTLFSKNHAETFELATEKVVDELKSQLKKHKEKQSDFSRQQSIDEEL